MSKHFTRDEALRVLPQVSRLLQEAILLKAQFQESEDALKATAREITMRGGMSVDRERMGDTKRLRDAALSRLQAVLEEIQKQGCMVKDLDTGLLDFPTLYDGREVYLCWRLGEASIEYWHGVDEGFAGRKPIDASFLAKHSGDQD